MLAQPDTATARAECSGICPVARVVPLPASAMRNSTPSGISMRARCSAPGGCGPARHLGVVVSNDLLTNGSRFLIIDNGRKIDVQIGVPLAEPAVYGGKVV
jgi:hypothetical protein